MKGLLDEANEVYLIKNNNPKRKLKYGLEIIKAKRNLVGVNTHMANKIVSHGLYNNLIKELKNENNYVFTTGGIGPTHDDITAESVSKAFGLKYEVHKEAYKILEKYYKPGEFNEGRQKMVWMPQNAKLILNPTSGAPGFSVENVFCLPGVPSILKSMLGGLKNRIVGGEPILSFTISLRTVESEIAHALAKVQNKNKDVEIGSYPFFHAGKLGVSIVLRSEKQSKIDICNTQILELVKHKKIEIVDR